MDPGEDAARAGTPSPRHCPGCGIAMRLEFRSGCYCGYCKEPFAYLD
nr:hypothetical protein [Candidatus Sigynarchaeum springense]